MKCDAGVCAERGSESLSNLRKARSGEWSSRVGRRGPLGRKNFSGKNCSAKQKGVRVGVTRKGALLPPTPNFRVFGGRTARAKRGRWRGKVSGTRSGMPQRRAPGAGTARGGVGKPFVALFRRFSG